jgi:octaprenyl-diphosphate synthase
VKSFKEISKNIKLDLENFEVLLNELFIDEDESLKEFFDFIFKIKGKRVRPALVYLFARMFGETNSTSHDAALLVELIHTATLLHDDVIDEAVLRRGVVSVNKKWDNKTAILLGDYLLAKSMQVTTKHQEYKLFDIITPSVLALSLGELEQQISNFKNFEINEEKYFKIIKNKTASLLSACCKAGAYSTVKDEIILEKAHEFGENLGIIFQIKDDILDYVGNEKTGKEKGIDIKEGKITLPLIRAFQNMSESNRNQLKVAWQQAFDDAEIRKNIIELTIKNNGIKSAEQDMQIYRNRALNILNEFPKCSARDALEELIDYVIERDK